MAEDYQTTQELGGNPGEATSEAIDTALKNLHTALPGIVEAFDPATQTARIRPAIKRIFTGKGELEIPVCADVPVQFPQGGGFCFTFPLQVGDEVILGFFERCIDRWYASGGTQAPAVYRMHDYSDGFAIPGVSSMPRVIEGFKANAVEMRKRDGSAYVSIDSGGNIEADGTLLTVKCAAVFEKLVTYQAGMSGTGGAGGAAITIDGDIVHTGSFTSNGKNVGSTHTHSGVQPGGGTSGQVS